MPFTRARMPAMDKRPRNDRRRSNSTQCTCAAKAHSPRELKRRSKTTAHRLPKIRRVSFDAGAREPTTLPQQKSTYICPLMANNVGEASTRRRASVPPDHSMSLSPPQCHNPECECKNPRATAKGFQGLGIRPNLLQSPMPYLGKLPLPSMNMPNMSIPNMNMKGAFSTKKRPCTPASTPFVITEVDPLTNFEALSFSKLVSPTSPESQATDTSAPIPSICADTPQATLASSFTPRFESLPVLPPLPFSSSSKPSTPATVSDMFNHLRSGEAGRTETAYDATPTEERTEWISKSFLAEQQQRLQQRPKPSTRQSAMRVASALARQPENLLEQLDEKLTALHNATFGLKDTSIENKSNGSPDTARSGWGTSVRRRVTLADTSVLSGKAR